MVVRELVADTSVTVFSSLRAMPLLHRFCKLAVSALLSLTASTAIADPENCKLRELASFDVTASTDGWVLVPVRLGNSTLQFAINPAEPFSLLGESVAINQQLTFFALERFDELMYAGLAKYSTEAPFQLGHALVKGTRLGVTIRRIGNDPRVAGILGLDVLSSFDMELDLGHAKVNLFQQNHCPGKVVYWAPELQTQPTKLDISGWFKVPVQVNGRTIDAGISLVSDGMYVNPHHAKENFGFEVRSPDMPTPIQPANGAPVIQPFMPHGYPTPVVSLGIEDVVVAGVRIADPSTHVFDCDDVTYSSKRFTCNSLAPLELGTSELRKLRLYFDFQEGQLFATAADAT